MQAPHDQTLARITKVPATLDDDIASAIAKDGTPVGPNHIIIVHQGQLYVLPDKDLGAGMMASQHVMKSASNAAN